MSARVERVLYFGHLILPILLSADVLFAAHLESDQPHLPFSDKVVLVVCVTWLIVGIVLPVPCTRRNERLKKLRLPLTILWCFYGTLIVGELGLRIFSPLGREGAALRPPGSVSEFRPSEDGIPISGVSKFTVNKIGLRGPEEPGSGSVYKIITLGSSTTEDEPQDDTHEWSHLLMDELNERQANVRVWVANAGVSGYTTVENLEEMKDLPVFSRANAVIMVLGETDMGATLSAGGTSTQAALDENADVLRQSILAHGTPVFNHPYYKRLRLYLLSKQFASTVLRKFGKEGITAEHVPLAMWRKERAEAPIRPIPDLSIGLAEYRLRIARLAVQCSALRIRCIFVTQPTLWSPTLSPNEQTLLWGGRLTASHLSDHVAYASPADLARAMQAWNGALLDVCRDQHLECFDLAPRVPKTNKAFYDDSHSTDLGAQMYAEAIAAYLLSTPPFHNHARTETRSIAEGQQPKHLHTAPIEPPNGL